MNWSEVPFLSLVGGERAGSGSGAGRQKLKKKGASALYCVYILKKEKVLYVFITLIIAIKSSPFF